MKTVLMTFESKPAGIYIANKMRKVGFLDLVILESSGKSKEKKLKRMLFKKLWRLPLNVLDVMSAWLYLKKVNGLMQSRLLAKNGFSGFPRGVEVFETGSVNSKECLKKLWEEKPDVMVVLGTTILSDAVISKSKYCLNVHGGMLPKYRNVRSEFWAKYLDDLDNFGSTIVHLDAGLDTGDIAYMRKVELSGGETLAEMKVKNTVLGIELLLKALGEIKAGRKLPRKKQVKSKSGFFPTPGFLDYLKLFLKK